MTRSFLGILLLALVTGIYLAMGESSSGSGEASLSPERSGAPLEERSDDLPSGPGASPLRREGGASSGAPDGQLPAPRVGLVRGRCIEHLTSAPLADLRLTFYGGDRELAQGTTDELGQFEVRIPQVPFDRVELQAGSPWWCVAQREQEGEHILRLAPHDLGVFRGRLVDSETHEPIPSYVLEVEDSRGWKETLGSDAEGLIRSELLFARGPLTFRGNAEELSDDTYSLILARLEHLPRGLTPTLVTVPIPTGPTYKLQLENPGGIALTNLRAYMAPLLWMDEIIGDRAEAFGLHDGDPVWVRFARTTTWVEDAHLIIADTGGRWCGHAQVELGGGIHEELVRIRLERRVHLRGRVIDDDNGGIARARVELIPLEDGSTQASRKAESNGLGNFVFENLRPGPYELFVLHHREGMARQRVEVSSDSKEPHLVRLESLEFAGDVAGVVRSLSGELRDPLTVQLKPLGTTTEVSPRRQIRIAWEQVGGSWEGHFRFESVPHGKYELNSILLRANYAIEPSSRELSPPAEFVEILVRDDVPRYRLGAIVVDGDSGRWLDEAQLRIVDQRGMVAFEGTAGRWAVPQSFADGEEFEWKVHHPGYISQRGGRADFDRRTLGHSHFAVFRLVKD